MGALGPTGCMPVPRLNCQKLLACVALSVVANNPKPLNDGEVRFDTITARNASGLVVQVGSGVPQASTVNVVNVLIAFSHWRNTMPPLQNAEVSWTPSSASPATMPAWPAVTSPAAPADLLFP